MGIYRNFPYSNFHEMNMDGIIKIIKDMLEDWATYHAEWDSWMDEIEDDWSNYQEVMNEAWQNMQDFINNYFDNLDVQEEINNKIVSMIQTGEFGMLVNEYIPPAVSAWLALHITQPTGVVIDTSLTVAGACADAKATGDMIRKIYSSKIVEPVDLVYGSDDFTIDNGSMVANTLTTPYSCAVFDAEEMTFKYRRRNSTYQFFVGVSVGGHFIGNQTANVITTINEIYGTTNLPYANAHLMESTGDAVYDGEYYEYTATLKNQRFTLRKGDTIILEFYIDEGITIDGIAFLNYYLSEIHDEADLIDLSIVNNPILNRAETYTDESVARIDLTGTDKPHRIVAGVIRNDGSGWDFITDTTHQGDLNCVSVSTNVDGQLIIDYSDIDATKIISFVIVPDETFASLGYMVGASVGKTQAYVNIYQNEPNAIAGLVECKNDQTITLDANSSGITSVTWDSDLGSIQVIHDSMHDSRTAIPIITPYIYARALPRVASMSGTSVRIEFIDFTTGTKLTQVSDKISFQIQRSDSTYLKKKMIDANTIINPNGNFWFMGIFKV